MCKCVSVQLITEARSRTAPAAPSADGSEPSIMWMSRIPKSLTDVSRLSYTNHGATMEEPRCPLRLHVDFGGPKGERLRLLNRVVGIFDVRYDLLIGLRFAYDDGTERFYGACQRLGNETCQRPCHEMSLIVDGKQGERVDSVTIIPYRPSGWFQEFVGGLQVRLCKVSRQASSLKSCSSCRPTSELSFSLGPRNVRLKEVTCPRTTPKKRTASYSNRGRVE